MFSPVSPSCPLNLNSRTPAKASDPNSNLWIDFSTWRTIEHNMALSAGDHLDQYTILDMLGQGGMGEVYRARDTKVGRDVAIKVAAATFSERFEREARIIASLNHPNICT